MNVSDSEFYMARISGEESLHDDRGDAIGQLQESANGLDPETDEFSVIKVAVDGDNWEIQEIAPSKIALELLQNGDNAGTEGL